MIRIARIAFVFAAILAFVMATLPAPPRLPADLSDKVQHVMAFLVLGGLGAIAFPRLSALRLLVLLAAFGAAIEVTQAIPSLNRDSELADFAAGAVAALVAIVAVRWLMARPHR